MIYRIQYLTKLFDVLKLVRYRFFLFAGLLPYFLGQAIAFGTLGTINWFHFWLGFAGIFVVLIAVELFNEYFDAEEGGDRVFSQEKPKIPKSYFLFGLLALGLAFFVGLYFAYKVGPAVLFFSIFGFFGAYFYVGGPIKWAYRGFGELVIGLCYGPLMVLGSFYIQTGAVSFVPFFVSLVTGLSIFCLAILNEIPDYYQDLLFEKRNLVVRFGKQKAIVLLKVGLAGVFILLISGIFTGIIPAFALIAIVPLPWVLKSIRIIEKNRDRPAALGFAVNTIVATHVLISLSVGVGFLFY